MRLIVVATLSLASWIGGPAVAQTPPPPKPPAFAPPIPMRAPSPATLPAISVPVPMPRRPAISPGAISRSMSREVHGLLYRLDQRVQQFTHDYNRPPAARPNVQQLDQQLDEIESLLAQLNRHHLPAERQSTLFKTEMNLRRLRETTVPDL